jgi:DNA-binding MurR/RpiR family transcriptional regulator
VIEHPEQLAFSTVAQISEAAGVQPSAFMRFCRVMGFSGYSEMQKLFRERFGGQWPDYATRLARLRESGGDTPEALLAEFTEAGRQSLDRLIDQVSPEQLQQAVDALASAPLIHIVGFRRSFPIACYLAYAFEKLGYANVLHDGGGLLTRHSLSRPGDALIAISFAPYTEQAVALAKDAFDLGLTVIAITDSVLSPLAQYSTIQLQVSELDVGAFRSLSATFSLAAALAIATGAERNRQQADIFMLNSDKNRIKISK